MLSLDNTGRVFKLVLTAAFERWLDGLRADPSTRRRLVLRIRKATQARAIVKAIALAEFDPSKYLDDDKAIADYIRLAIEDGDPGLLAAALGDVASARGMTQVAQGAGLTRKALYKALRPEAHPRFDTIRKLCTALGVKLTATAA
jgi:probable addiction module antidote protein